MQFYNILDERTVEEFDLIIDYTYSWEHPYEVFPKEKYDVDLILKKIDNRQLEYFDLRIRALFKGTEFARETIINLLYKDAYDILKQEELEDVIDSVIYDAKEKIVKLKILLGKLLYT